MLKSPSSLLVLISLLVISILGASCCAGPAVFDIPANTSLIYPQNGSVWEVTNAEEDPVEVLSPVFPSPESGLYLVYSQCVAAQGGQFLYWVRCFTEKLPQGKHIVRPQGPWILGVTDRQTGSSKMIRQSEYPIHVWRWHSHQVGGVVRMRNLASASGDTVSPLYDFFNITNAKSSNPDLQQISEEVAKSIEPPFKASGQDGKKSLAFFGDWWLGPMNEWMFFSGRELGSCGFHYYAGMNLATGEERIFQAFDSELYKF